MYSDRLLDHFRNPRNTGELQAPSVGVEVSNPACGDVLRLSVRIEGGRVAEARFKAHGCTASIAAGSAVTELIAGKNLNELTRLAPVDIEQALDGLPPTSRHAAALAVDAVRALAASWPG
jgi:nitrogen fixation NifU-like protein